jgi:hypothetical protein
MTQITESDYKTAQLGDAKVRQDFLNAIDFGSERTLFEEIKYIPRSDLDIASFLGFDPEGDDEMRMEYRGMQTKPGVVIYGVFAKTGFIKFMNILLEHEMHHVRQCSFRPWGFLELYELRQNPRFREYANAIVEIPACLNQIKANARFKIGESEVRIVLQDY